MALITFIMVIYAFLADCLIFHETFTWIELLAASVIFFTLVLTSVIKLR